jgi:RNA polymerase sigma-70 factor (ECF subfamily)
MATHARSHLEEWPSDEAALAGFGAGDDAAGRAFVRRYQGRVYGLARRLVGDATEAEGIAQEAMIRVWRHADAYDARRGSVSSWVLTITRNLAVDALRKKKAQPIDPSSVLFLDQQAQNPDLAETVAVADEASRVRAVLRHLPTEQRRALLLAAFYGYTAKEISRVEMIPLGTAKSRIRMGLTKVRGLLALDGAGATNHSF